MQKERKKVTSSPHISSFLLLVNLFLLDFFFFSTFSIIFLFVCFFVRVFPSVFSMFRSSLFLGGPFLPAGAARTMLRRAAPVRFAAAAHVCLPSIPAFSSPSSFALPRESPQVPSSLYAQRAFFSISPSRWIQVRGKPRSSNSIDRIHALMNEGGRSDGRQVDSLTPYVRQHLFRVYSLVGATALAAAVGSGLMIMTPLVQVVSPMVAMIGSMIPILWLSFAPPANPTAKVTLLISSGLLAGMGIAPLVLMSSMKGVLLTSLTLTAAVFGGFSAAAYLAPRASMVAWQGPLFGGLMGLMAISLFSIFFPSAIGHSLVLYGGLALFSVMIASDTQTMIERARCGEGDYVGDALSMFMNLLNIFIRIMQIMSRD